MTRLSLFRTLCACALATLLATPALAAASSSDGINSSQGLDLPIGAGGTVAMIVGGGQSVAPKSVQFQSNLAAVGTITAGGNVVATGEAQVGNSGAACSSANAGAVRYDQTAAALKYCNGTDWVRPGAGILASGAGSGAFSIDQPGVLIAGFTASHSGTSDSALSGSISVDGSTCTASQAYTMISGREMDSMMSMTCVKRLSAGAHSITGSYDSSYPNQWIVIAQ
jgi:hypothetical protein